jgi:hypothetical protein
MRARHDRKIWNKEGEKLKPQKKRNQCDMGSKNNEAGSWTLLSGLNM